ncbi:MAG: FtsX-like permease family protein [Firmicutes bacterium ADurb.Bin354]|nr:MAG: FtsX-like permease family protein [Firmicutes bacterium ADurb.Bin354]
MGTVFGIILCRFMINNFILNTLTPEFSVFLIIGIIMSLSFMLLMVIFSFLTLGRMRKISVMDTIHGENRGERFTKIPGVFLHKSRKISVPFFLAAQDVTGRIRRYIYLVISYSLGLVMLLMVSQLKDTVVSHDFRTTYWQVADRELFIRPEDNLRDKLISQEGSYRNVFLYYERYYNEHGIPLNIQITDIQIGNIILRNGTKVGTEIFFDNEDVELERMVLVDGGKTPSLENEIAISHFLKDKEGINLGDTVTLEYKIYKEDGFTQETIRKDFIVTAFVESMAMSSMPRVYMAENDENIVADNWDIFNEGLDVPDDEYDETIEKMRAVNEDILIWDFDQVLDYDLGNKFGVIFDLLMITMAIVMTLTLFAMTFLYQQIFIEEETADIAMLKSLGVSGSSIRRWQYLRILMLVMIAIVISVILAFTASKALFGKIGVSALGVAKFTFASPSIFALIVFPLGLIILVTISLMLSFRPIDNIQIWRVRNE